MVKKNKQLEKFEFKRFTDFLNILDAKKPTTQNQLKDIIGVEFKGITQSTAGSRLKIISETAFENKVEKKIGLNVLKQLFPYYKLAYPMKNGMYSALGNAMSDLRKVLKKHNPQLYPESKLHTYFNLPLEEQKLLKSRGKQKVKTQNNNLMFIDDKKIIPIIEGLPPTFNKKKYHMAIYIMAATGSRQLEVFNKSKYEVKGDMIHQTNIAKKGDNTKNSSRTYPPLFGDAKTIVNLVATLRSKFKKVVKKNGTLVANINNMLNKTATKLFPGLFKQVNDRGIQKKMSIFRKIYARGIYLKLGLSTSVNFMTYIQKILDHTSLETSENYSWVRFESEKSDKKKVDKLNDRIDTLEIELMKFKKLWEECERKLASGDVKEREVKEREVKIPEVKEQKEQKIHQKVKEQKEQKVNKKPLKMTAKRKERLDKLNKAYDKLISEGLTPSVRLLKTRAKVGSDVARKFLKTKK